MYNVRHCKENNIVFNLREKNNFISSTNQSYANEPRDFALMLHVMRYASDDLINTYDVFFKAELVVGYIIMYKDNMIKQIIRIIVICLTAFIHGTTFLLK